MPSYDTDYSYSPTGHVTPGVPTHTLTNADFGYGNYGAPIVNYAQGVGGGDYSQPIDGVNYSLQQGTDSYNPFLSGQVDAFGRTPEQAAMADRMAAMGGEARRSGDIAMGEAARMRGVGVTAAAMMDPFAPYRGAFAQQMMQLQRSPAAITSMPGYSAGLQAVQRQLGAQGYQGSGNMAAELAQFGGDFYNRTMAQLGQLAGAGAAPGAGAGVYAQAAQQAADLTGQGLASRGYAAGLGY